jgi:hypothetical protein
MLSRKEMYGELGVKMRIDNNRPHLVSALNRYILSSYVDVNVVSKNYYPHSNRIHIPFIYIYIFN